MEALERRTMLSAVQPMLASPQAEAADPAASGLPPVGALTPFVLRRAYGIDSIKFGSITGDGSGQTIAIVGAFDNPRLLSSTDPNFANSDLHKFDEQFMLPDPPSFVKVNQNDGSHLPLTDPGWAREAALDVEWAHAIAPKANIVLVEAASNDLDHLIDAGVGYARQQPGVSVVTMSFAAPEQSQETGYDSLFTTPAGQSGVSFVAATGDLPGMGGYPATSPNVVAVGATQLTLQNGLYSSETGSSGSFGGVSKVEPKPGYQALTSASNQFRTIPDVSIDGHKDSAVAVYDSFNNGTVTPWAAVSGTSLSAQVWGSLLAITDQGRALEGLGPLDSGTQTLPRLYELNGSDFHDITTGNNGFAAGVGYDLVTGRGTPRANLLVPHLAGGSSISGVMFSDNNANGIQNTGEAPLFNWGTFIDFNNNGVRDGIDFAVHSDASGRYNFTDLPGGTYHINQVPLPGWKRTTPKITVTLGYGSNVTGQNDGNQPPQAASITGIMFEDINGDRIHESNEPILYNWGIFLDMNNNGVRDAGDIGTHSDLTGRYTFTGLTPGVTYPLRQNPLPGYTLTTPSTGFPWLYTPTSGQQRVLNVGYRRTQISDSAVIAAAMPAATMAPLTTNSFDLWSELSDAMRLDVA
jgi:subtilase family serine protease